MSQYVLVVDDDAALGRTVARCLRKFNFPVYLATGPASAWALLHREGAAPALLITDVQLGTDDGRNLARQLRRLYPGMPVVLMSGGFDSMHEPRVLGRGPQRFMRKPFAADDLRVFVHELLGTPSRDT